MKIESDLEEKRKDTMQFTLFGAIWLVVLVIAGVKGQKCLAKAVIFSALFQAGAVIIIGNSVIVPLTFSCIVYDIFYFLRHISKSNIRIPKFFIVAVFLWLLVLLESLFSALLFKGILYMPTNNNLSYEIYRGDISFYGLAEWIIYFFTSLLMYNEIHINRKEFDRFIDLCFYFVFFVGVCQYTTKLGIIPQISIFENLIYSNTVSDSNAYLNTLGLVANRFSGVRFYSSFMEASYAAGFLNVLLYYYFSKCLSDNKHTSADIIKTILTFAMIMLTLSTTAYVMTVIVFAFVVWQNKGTIKLLKLLLIVSLLAILGAIAIDNMGLWDSIIFATFEKTDSLSMTIRNTWNESSLKTLLDTYGLGLGFGNIRGSSLFYTLLGSIGIFGVFGYGVFIVSIMKNPTFQLSNKVMLSIIIIAQFISIGIYNYSVFWMILFLMASSTSDIVTNNSSNNVSDFLQNSNNVVEEIRL